MTAVLDLLEANGEDGEVERSVSGSKGGGDFSPPPNLWPHQANGEKERRRKEMIFPPSL